MESPRYNQRRTEYTERWESLWCSQSKCSRATHRGATDQYLSRQLKSRQCVYLSEFLRAEPCVPHDLRTTVWVCSKMSRVGRSGFSTRCNIVTMAIAPISAQFWCCVVSGTGKRLEYFTSSIPTMRISSGTRIP